MRKYSRWVMAIGYYCMDDKKKNTAIALFLLKTVDVRIDLCYNTT